MDPTSAALLTTAFGVFVVILAVAVLAPNGVSVLALAKLNPTELGVEICVEIGADDVIGDACTVDTTGVAGFGEGVDALVALPDKNEKLPIELVFVMGVAEAVIGVFSLSGFGFSFADSPKVLLKSNLNALVAALDGLATEGGCGGIFGVANRGADFTVDGFGVILKPVDASGCACGICFKLALGVGKSAGFGSLATDAGGIDVADFAKFNASDLPGVLKPNVGVGPNEKPVDMGEFDSFVGSVFAPNENPLDVVDVVVFDEAVSKATVLLKLLLRLVFKLGIGSGFTADLSVVIPNGDDFSLPKIGFVSIGFDVGVVCGDPKFGFDKFPNNDEPIDVDDDVGGVMVGFRADGICFSTTSFGFGSSATLACCIGGVASNGFGLANSFCFANSSCFSRSASNSAFFKFSFSF